jgi:prepilin signal peptidase PulO-like enzyme (type II secretory pathway)
VLDDSEIKKIAKMYKQDLFDFKEVTVQNTLPFAPLIFLGVIITILTRGTLLILLHI